MLLSELAATLGLPAPAGADPEVTGITHNSAWVTPGDAFVAVRGTSMDGHSFADDAARRGAVAILGTGAPEGFASELPYLEVANDRVALADGAAALMGHPSRELAVLGVTGTDGKTTTTSLARHVLRATGRATGMLSTVGYELPDGELRQFPEHLTTPEAPQVQALLREMVDAGAEVVVLEASSHAIALERVRGVEWDVAIWTNLTGDHLNFHGSMEAYFAEKRRLVEAAPFAVLNQEDPWAQQLAGVAAGETTYSIDGAEAEWQAGEIRETPAGIEFTLHSPQGVFPVFLPMVGRFNVANTLAALAGTHRLGVGVAEAVEALRSFPGVPGRMQVIQPTDQVQVVVDFAHTAPALEKAITALRRVAPGEVWVVIGAAGGNRDASKRAPLGATATQFADQVVFTEEDYRDTPLEEILAEMERGATEAGRSNFRTIPDRVEAIGYCVDTAPAGTMILLAGKGPEDFMTRGDRMDPWDEAAVAAEAVAARSARAAQE
ncbi:MAG TPA: UDP-N-acetylmuramoyl-L-alanyl-D-glutamate--2,6-diaminopimelate ligase [Actinomycetales bacterium]|nr:UDP-N-acetylmuramoyl-L-alanyl-D-glutamate--2,6-diaminopimelate ligase [Actinomycetales bacterium]